MQIIDRFSLFMEIIDEFRFQRLQLLVFAIGLVPRHQATSRNAIPPS